MFNISGTEIIVILLLALVVLGPEKLPDAMRRAGRTYAELKRMSSSFQSEMRSALDEPMKEMRDTADLLRNAATFDASATSAQKPSAEPKPPSQPATSSTPETWETSAEAGEPATELTDDELVARTLSGGATPAPPDAAADTAAEPEGDPLAADDADRPATA